MDRTILVIDDDPHILATLARFFEIKGWTPLMATDGEMGLEAYRRERPDLVVLDLQLPGMHGLEVLDRIRRHDPRASVVILTGHGDVPTAVKAMRAGAESLLTKPVELEHFEAAVERAIEKQDLVRLNRNLTQRLSASGDGLAALGSSPLMQDLAAHVRLLAGASNTTVLLLGESGTGKGWLARMLHDESGRASRPFIDINCAGLSTTFLHSELFGHERGAFTDAKERKRGLFEVANGGTLFLDEIAELAPEIQPKLLKVLEERRFRRLGGTREVEVDVRLVAATNQDLAHKVAGGEFRQDLYYRLKVMPVFLPPLRERPVDDLLGLVGRLFVDLSRQMGARDAQLSDEILERMCAYSWPGNVREVRNVLERALILAGGPSAELILSEHLPAEVGGSLQPMRHDRDAGHEPVTLALAEGAHVARALDYHRGNRSRAAATLGITRATLLRKIAKFGLEDVGREA